jgi:hypothetical protein
LVAQVYLNNTSYGRAHSRFMELIKEYHGICQNHDGYLPTGVTLLVGYKNNSTLGLLILLPELPRFLCIMTLNMSHSKLRLCHFKNYIDQAALSRIIHKFYNKK